MVTIPTRQQLRDQIITDIESTRTIPLPSVSGWRVLATALAAVLWLAYRFGQWCYDQISVSTCDEAELLKKGSDFGVKRNPATYAKIIATATGTNGSIISAGQLYAFGTLVYQVVSDATISLGTAQVTLKCLTAGTVGNMTSGTLQTTSPVAGVNDALTYTSAAVVAADVEELETYRYKIKNRMRTLPQGGAVPDYIKWATEVPGIVAAFIGQTVAGYVTVYPLVSITGASRVPILAKRDEVLAYLTDTSRKPITASVNVGPMVESGFVVTITGGLPSDMATKNAVQTAIQNHLWSRYPLQYPDDLALVNVVSTANLTAIAISAGLQTGILTMTKGGSNTTAYTLSINELATLTGSITWA